MSTDKNYQKEWAVLQSSYDQYERYGLVIKITAIILFVAAFALNTSTIILTFALLVLWLQEAIWKTFQSRTEQRLLTIEANLNKSNSPPAYQFYSEWETNRPSTLGLVKDYITQAFRPTIAFPYIILIIISLLPIS